MKILAMRSTDAQEVLDDNEQRSAPAVDQPRIAVVPIAGPLRRYGNVMKLTARVRKAADTADGLLLYIDSPGGEVSGIDELATEVRRARERITVVAHYAGRGLSAACWVGSQASFVTAARTAEVGAIGVFTVVEDISEMLESEGVKVHLIASGPYKGIGVLGTQVTEEQLAELQQRVDDLGAMFVSAVADGRGVARESIEAIADGRDWLGADAQQVGLIDQVATLEDSVMLLMDNVARQVDMQNNRLGLDIRKRRSTI
jgi:signal peptide peptidase SppA